MKPWVWAWNAGLRTLRGVHPALARPDDAWAEARLPDAERALYRAMDPRERDHHVRVARTILARHPDATPQLVRAALLHDVGKSQRPYRVIERILVHLVRGEVPAPQPIQVGWQGARQVAAHHAAYGASMILEAGGDPRVAELVSRHEQPEGDVEATALHEADRRT